ncbi:MAG TPA: transglutaminase-like domain-containing protein [Abditibacteriaceae bacterium]|nr:transglutaminase-like domain-containing protein [Abditibacteriaceae bacterium]
MMTATLAPEPKISRLPWTATAAVLIAFTALHLTGSGFALLPFLALALSAAYLFDARLDNGLPVVRMLRLIIFGLVAATAFTRLRSDNMESPEMVLAHSAGQLCALEVVLQYWLRRPTGGPRGPIVILLSGLVMMAASNTFDEHFIRFLVPAYIFFLTLSLGDFAEVNVIPGTSLWRRRAIRSLALLLVLAGGAGAHFVVWTYRGEITQLGMNLLGENRAPETIGLSTTPRLGASFNVQGSLGRVLRAEGLPRDEYLRAMSFAEYSQGKWKPAIENRVYVLVGAEQLLPGAAGRAARVERLIDDASLLFMPLNCAGLAAPVSSELEWAREAGGPLRSIDPAPDPYEYSVFFDDNPVHQGPLCVPLNKGERSRCLAIPAEIDERVRVLARRIAGDISDPRERVRAVADYLTMHHAYSLTFQPGPGDPVSNFLLSDKSAHCEYFASAATILLRCLGVPTRYVIGYLAHEPDGPNAVVVRGRDAHAWAESWIDGTGWITVDATPGGGRPDARAEPLPFWLKVREFAQRLIMAVRNSLARLGRINRVLLLGVAVCTLIALSGWKLWRARRMVAPTVFAYSLPAADLAALAARFERWLRRHDSVCPPQRTWREHFDLAAVPLADDDRRRATTFLDIYNAVRFGGADDVAVEYLRELLNVLERE